MKENLEHNVVNLAMQFAFKTAKPFNVDKQDFNLSGIDDFKGNSWLTSLAIKADDLDFVFNEVVMSVTQEKNIVTTSMPGYNGTVKEFIGDGDYNITVNAGVIAGACVEEDADGFCMPENRYPEEEMKKLKQILSIQSVVAVHSDFLEIFEIRSAVIKSFSLTQETHSNRQSIQIQMISDKPFEIEQLGDANFNIDEI